ncbi:MAG: NAD(P)/FAD-dependent oxidoreductase [Candidatus Saccharimonadales bacterium]
MKHYEIIVLGTGGAGYQVAMRAAEKGRKVAVINDGPFGGTCSVRGCIPKKVLAGTAEIADINRRLNNLQIVEEQPTMNWRHLVDFKRSFTEEVPINTEKSLRNANIDTFTGSPRFIGNLAIEINDQTLDADKIHIAVGASPAKVPIDGFEHMATSDDFLELNELPERIVFVGGGYISFEFAHIAARFGSHVTILHGDDKPIAMFDDDMVAELLKASEEIGIDVVLNKQVSAIKKKANIFEAHTKDGQLFKANLVVHGAGRTPAIANLNLEATNVEYDSRQGILVNEHLQSISNPNIYAAGDCAAAGPPLSPVAGVQGSIVASNILGDTIQQPEYLSTPSVLFTTPVVASVGHSKTSATKAGLKFKVVNADTSQWFDAKRLGQTHSKSKVLIEEETKRILGAHLIGNHAENLINIFSLAIELRLTAEDLKKPIMAFPTASDDIRSML